VETFWLWILGLTDQVVHSKIAFHQYDEWFQDCQRELLTLTNQILDKENDTYMTNTNVDDEDEMNRVLYSNVKCDTDNKKVGNILPQQEFRFMFLRSWTLYNSVFYSSYVVSKLRLWQEIGQRELTKFFAMLGIPSDQYNQQYKFMDYQFKTILKDKITDIAPKFDLQNLLFSSFIRQIDNKTQINASDMVYAVTALLESPRPVMVDNLNDNNAEEREAEEAKNDEKAFELTHEMQVENFWAALDSLDLKNTSHLHYGIELAKELQMALVRTSSSLISNKKVKPGQKFRYAIIQNDALADAKMFQYPLAIQKLALFIMEAYKETRAVKENTPMVLFVKNSKRDSYLVAGVLGQDSMMTGSKNEFGNCFVSAAEQVDAKFKQDGFET
jgi:cell division control protein 45